MPALGTPAPYFRLPDVISGKPTSLDDFQTAKALVVMFICRHCPFVRHIQRELARFGDDYAGKPVATVAISSNDASEYPDDAPESLREMAVELGFKFPFCYDEDQQTARAYSAACTPDFFVFDKQRKLAYRGQFDDSRPGNNLAVTGRDLRAAVDQLLADLPVAEAQKPSIGCNIKWRKAQSTAQA